MDDENLLTEEIKPLAPTHYDFERLNLQEFVQVDPQKPRTVRMLVPPEDEKFFPTACWVSKVQVAVYIEDRDTGEVLKDKRKELYHEKRLHRRG